MSEQLEGQSEIKKSRWRVETVVTNEESEGPDFYTDYEIHVIDNRTDKVVKEFSGSTANGICYSHTQGIKYVLISKDESYLIVVDGEDHEKRILLRD